jgi:hypothetical protein
MHVASFFQGKDEKTMHEAGQRRNPPGNSEKLTALDRWRPVRPMKLWHRRGWQ